MITSTKNRQNYFIPATIAYMAILAYLQLRNPSGSGGAGISSVRQLLNNLAHIPAYAILTWLLLRNFLTVDFKAKVSAIAIASTYGIFMELLQSLNPERLASFGDVCLNTIGIIFIIWLNRCAFRNSPIKQE